MPESDPNKTNIFNAYIAEYNSLRAELLARIQNQNQAFNFLLIVVGAAITAVITTANSDKHGNLTSVTLAVALLLPFVTCPLAYIFFDNELMIHAIGSYIYWDRRVKITEHLNNPEVFKSIADFSYLPPSTASVFQPISRGRWFLFCLPTFLPIVFVPVYIYQQLDFLPNYSTTIQVSAAILFLLNFIEAVILARAIGWVYENNNYQHKITREN